MEAYAKKSANALFSPDKRLRPRGARRWSWTILKVEYFIFSFKKKLSPNVVGLSFLKFRLLSLKGCPLD
jgi:hypothetical protein